MPTKSSISDADEFLKRLRIQMPDNSILELEGAFQQAWGLKYGGLKEEERKQLIEQIKKSTKNHWDKRTIPTKYGDNERWDRDYKDQSELGISVIYPLIRGAVFAVIFGGARPTVTEVGSNGVTEYSAVSAKKVRDFDFCTKTKKKNDNK